MRKATVVVVALLAVGMVVGLWYGVRPAYKRHKERRCVEQARRFMAKKDYRNASLSVRQAYQANPASLEACRLRAELAELARSPSALDWRRRVVDLAPTLENKLALAATGLRAQGPPFPLATQVLEDLADSGKTSASYQVIAGELALKMNQTRQAEVCFAEARRLEPTNELHQLNLAVLRLRSTNSTAASDARAALEGLSASTNLGAVALRWLVAEAASKNDLPGAQGYSARLLTNSHVTLDDRLQHLSILRQTASPQYGPVLGSIKQAAASSPIEVYTVSAWLISRGLAQEAMQWLTNLPPKLRAEQPIPLAFVDCYLARKDWAGLETYLQQQKWTELEFLRLAFLSHAAAQQQQDQAADTRWRMALQKAGDRLGALSAMLGMANNWGRQKAKEELLWQIAQRFPTQRWALRELDRYYSATGNTRSLNKLYGIMANYDPKDFVARNNCAATACLLKINLAKAHETAKEVYGLHPDDAVVASTYAYSLHLQKRTKQGLAVMEKLKPAELEKPAIALYYGLLLGADAQTDKARQYLELAKGAQLLPEEQELLAAAVKSL